MVTAANTSDRDAAKELLFRLALTHPEISIVRADSAYAGKLVTWAKTYLDSTIKTVRRPPDVKGFVVLPRRRVVERSWSWMTRRPTRRTARTAERRDVSPYHLAQAGRQRPRRCIRRLSHAVRRYSSEL